ncbi:MAG: SbcC/MukB-like Walker B domain-containing protein, partial [Actinomycetes bacterium]
SIDENARRATEATELHQQAETSLSSAKAALAKALPLIERVRTLDVQIGEKHGPIADMSELVTDLTSEQAKQRSEQQMEAAELADTRAKQADLQQLVSDTQSDESLVEQFAGIRARFAGVKAVHAELEDKQQEVAGAQLAVVEATERWEQASAASAAKRVALVSVQTELDRQRLSIQSLLHGQSLAEWRVKKDSLTARKDTLEQALTLAESVVSADDQLDSLGLKAAELRGEVATSESRRAELVAQQEVLDKEIDHLEVQLRLLNQIHDLTQARQQLQDGSQCPLCGSREHPFAQGNVPEASDTDRRLALLKSQRAQVATELTAATVAVARRGQELEANSNQQEALATARVANRNGLEALCAQARVDVAEPDLARRLTDLGQSAVEDLANVTQTITTAEALENTVAGLRETVREAEREVNDAHGTEAQADFAKTSSVGDLARLTVEAAGLGERRQTLLTGLQGELSNYAVSIGDGNSDDLDRVQQQLDDRRSNWISRSDELVGLNAAIAQLEQALALRGARIDDLDSDLQARTVELASRTDELKALQGERRALFGEADPHHEQRRLDEDVKNASQQVEHTRSQATETVQALKQVRARVDALGTSTGQRREQLSLLEGAFGERLGQSAFTDEAAYRAASMPADERKTLTQRSAQLAHDLASLTSLHEEKATALTLQQSRSITGESLVDLRLRVATHKQESQGLAQEVGSINSRLDSNERAKERALQKVAAIDAKKADCARWDDLHELIGSADGKRFRNFAQGLTFSMMIGHANQQLVRMTDRYLLVNDDEHPLELSVIDTYQGSEMRSTKNLSGGESFIVSLALALGLSQMASRNVRVDSLFLDEGFGTLDEDALDTALDTLSNLQQEGKMIGIISHVPALKDRIRTQIQVTPRTGGRSELSGPGCGRARSDD